MGLYTSVSVFKVIWGKGEVEGDCARRLVENTGSFDLAEDITPYILIVAISQAADLLVLLCCTGIGTEVELGEGKVPGVDAADPLWMELGMYTLSSGDH